MAETIQGMYKWLKKSQQCNKVKTYKELLEDVEK